MDKDEIKEVAEYQEVMSPESDPAEAPADSQADGDVKAVETVGETESETQVDDTPDGDVAESSSVDRSDVEIDDVSDEEIAMLEKKVANLQRKIELTDQLRKQTKRLLDMGAVLRNTDDVIEPEDMETVDESEDDVPAIEETEYVDVPDKITDEENE